VRFANEGIGMADPQAIHQTLAAWDVYERLGSPEGELAIAQAVVYLATAPKSIAVYRGLGAAAQAASPTDHGYEQQIRDRLTRWAQLRGEGEPEGT
jgi:putative ATPase